LGLVPAWNPQEVGLASPAADGFVCSMQPLLAPSRTPDEGVFVAGAAAGPKDIPDSVLDAGAAAMEAAAYLHSLGRIGANRRSHDSAEDEQATLATEDVSA
jgi:heterodisulfide reductase subunit A2